MMGSLDVQLTWAIPVKPDVLVAHVETYIKLLPMLNTLRLCNRFGQGTNAAITRLPPELVSLIEEDLFVEELQHQRMRCSEQFKCWKGMCKFKDHFSDTQLRQMYEDVIEACDDCQDSRPMNQEATLSKQEHDSLRDHLQNLPLEEREELWSDSHHERARCWLEKTGSPSGWPRGHLISSRPIFLAHFGLDLWIVHKAVLDNDIVLNTTKAYISYPECVTDSVRIPRYKERQQAEDGAPDYCFPNGLGMAFLVPRVPKLTPKVTARFDRVFRMLDLPRTFNAIPQEPTLSIGLKQPSAAEQFYEFEEFDYEDEDEGSEEEGQQPTGMKPASKGDLPDDAESEPDTGGLGEVGMPKLMFLTRTRAEDEEIHMDDDEGPIDFR